MERGIKEGLFEADPAVQTLFKKLFNSIIMDMPEAGHNIFAHSHPVPNPPEADGIGLPR